MLMPCAISALTNRQGADRGRGCRHRDWADMWASVGSRGNSWTWRRGKQWTIICGKYGNNRSRTENVTERTRFSKSWSNDLEDIGQGQRSLHATHLLMLVIICTKYGKNPSRTVDATEWTRFSRSRPNDFENIGQGQRSSHATHPLMLMMISAKYGKNASRILDFFSRWKPKN